MIQFALVSGEEWTPSPPLSVADRPEELDFSKLHHCGHWSVWVRWEYAHMRVASVDWSGCGSYVFYDAFTMDRTYIHKHDHIIPLIRGELFYHNMFNRYVDPASARGLLVYPCED
jgi:hypothetical protein